MRENYIPTFRVQRPRESHSFVESLAIRGVATLNHGWRGLRERMTHPLSLVVSEKRVNKSRESPALPFSARSTTPCPTQGPITDKLLALRATIAIREYSSRL